MRTLVFIIFFLGFRCCGSAQPIFNPAMLQGTGISHIEHPYYRKFKHRPAYNKQMVPPYLKADPSSPSENAYCLEYVYVKPLYLYKPELEHSTMDKYSRKKPQVNRSFRQALYDTTFLPLETLIERILFTKSTVCNSNYFQLSEVSFPFNTDSIISLEVITRLYQLPPDDSATVAEYSKSLEKAIQEAENHKPKKRRSCWFKRRKRLVVDSRPYMPVLEIAKLPMPDYDVDIPEPCDSIITETGLNVSPRQNFLNNGYYSWEPVVPCFDFAHSKSISKHHTRYYSTVLNPYTLKPYDPELLIGKKFREVVYNEMKALYEQLKSNGNKHPFNIHHYHPEQKRHFMWGLEKDRLIIYYGNEGEFSSYKKHYIPLNKFL